jgi:transporter family-2 protein
MNEAGAILSGVLISLMLGANSALEHILGPVRALLVINLAGLLAVLLFLVASRRKIIFRKGIHWIYYSAGASGIVLTFLNNWTIGVLGVTVALTAGILGQILASAVIDHFGLFGIKKRPFRMYKAAGFFLVAAGILVMTAGKGA